MTRQHRHTAIQLHIGLLLALLTFTQAASAQIADNKWTAWFEMGGKLSDELHNGEAELFVPLLGDGNSLLFVDFEGRIFEDSIRDGNFALGYREMTNTGFNAGVWIGYAPFRSENGNVYHGIAGGLELLSHNFDLRLNGYLPFDDDRLISQTTNIFADLGTDQFPATGFIFTDLFVVTDTISTREHTMRGFDGEVGALLPFTPGNFELRTYVGGYFFDDGIVDDIAGFKSRLELRVLDVLPGAPGSRLTVDAAYAHDDVRDGHWYAGARLRVPFGGPDTTQTDIAQLNGQERRMLDAINREDPIAQTNTTLNTLREKAEDALTDVPFDRVALVANSANAADLQTAINASGGNSLIIANGGATFTGQTVLQDNQTLMGGGGKILVRGQETGAVTGFGAPGVRPTLRFTGIAPVLTMANNSHVADLDVVGVRIAPGFGNHGIFGDVLTNVVIEEVNVSDIGSTGIRFEFDSRDILIFGSTLSNIGGTGILIGIRNTNFTVNRNTLVDIAFNGITLVSNNNNVKVSGNTLTDIGDEGILFVTNNTGLTITNNAIVNVVDDAFDFENVGNILVNATGNSASGVGGSICEGAANFTGTLNVNGLSFIGPGNTGTGTCTP